MTVTPGAHLTKAQVDALGEELDALRDEVLADRGQRDADYIRKVVDAQHKLEVGGRAAMMLSILPPFWLAGVTMLSTSKILADMEIGHNVMHGQWDWMRDPELHSSTFEWDTVSTSEGWKHTHNYLHHTYTNVIGMDRDLGYTIMRVSGDQDWKPVYLAQPFYNVVLALTFEWAIALYDLEFEKMMDGRISKTEYAKRMVEMSKKMAQQSIKDYVVWPALSGISAPTTLVGNFTSNIVRNVWAHAVIFCGHFPDGGATFSEEDVAGESRGEWYLRQMEGSCNISGGELLHVMTGNLSFQIEHHIFPDLPSNRYKEISPKVQEICARYGIEYTTGPMWKQYGQVLGRIARFALPGGKKTDDREIDPARTSARNPRVAEAADASDRRQARGVRNAGLRSPLKVAAAADTAAVATTTSKAKPATTRAKAKPTTARAKSSTTAKPTAARAKSGTATKPTAARAKSGTATKAKTAAKPRAKSVAATNAKPSTATTRTKAKQATKPAARKA